MKSKRLKRLPLSRDFFPMTEVGRVTVVADGVVADGVVDVDVVVV